EHCVGEQSDGERGEAQRETRMRRGRCLHDHRPPGHRTYEHGQEVETDGGRDPMPLDGRERVSDTAPRRPTPPEHGDDSRGGEDDDDGPYPAAVQEPPHAATSS